MCKKNVLTIVAVTLAVFAGPAQAGTLSGELGLLSLTKDYGAGEGNNPATGNPWALGDPYHLMYVTSTPRDATSSDIAEYNAFVQADADAEGIGASVGVTWSVLGSTATVNAIDNVTIMGPVFGIYDSTYLAVDADDFWDLAWPSGGLIWTLAGDYGDTAHAWTGTTGGGVANAPLGDESVRFEWLGWSNWSAASKYAENTTLYQMVALSEPLVIIPEPATICLLGLGGLALLRRKRR